jgi:signal transduction histidine kinase
VSDLTEAENRYERPDRKLLEVYLLTRTPSGEPLLFEAYLRYDSVTEKARRISLAVAPAFVAALLLLWLVQLPLAWWLARRLREGQRQRESLLERAIEASDVERRRIAADLHDGVVQDLAGVAFSLGAAAERATAPDVKETLSSAADGTRQSMRRLRSLLVEIYPATLESAGLESALSDLVTPLSAKGINARLDVDPDFEAPPAVEQLLFRGAHEALRNVTAHSHAENVDVRISRNGDSATLLVSDDGRGFAPELAEERRARGHLGLSLLAGLVTDAGGELTVESEPGDGTRVTLEVPI